MPFIEINAAQIYYQAFGADQPGKEPILLIHGSTITGQEDWGLIAPLLARDYRVIVPDCRGHGQSSNPTLSYSFKEMADDVAALVHALGYKRAHIIGHSNGGNVALVTLLEHPEAVQTAILQAANAYVSQDLVDKEPHLFDPDRVQNEAPNWMKNMIRLHGPTHGQEYWRDLLRLTVQEIITEPNYAPADLGKVERPVFIIQGENDTVNAPARHAQFMAENIPYAEQWLPAGVGHNVHTEATLEWIRRILDFLDRRGTDPGEALHRLKCSRYADDRDTIFQPQVRLTAEGLHLSGQVLTVENAEAVRQAITQVLPSTTPMQDELRVLLTPETPWALIRRGVTDLRREPRNLSERISQALLGEFVRILHYNDPLNDWARVRLEKDGYMGWIHSKALHPCSAAEAAEYSSACNAQVVAELAVTRDSPPGEMAPSDSQLPGKLPFGAALAVVSFGGAWLQVRLPDGRSAWLQRGDVMPNTERPHTDAAGIQATLALIRRFAGVPYLWGGRTPFGYDCSGLAQAFHAFLGVHIPRDADQQYRMGQPITGTPHPGDLIYFGDASTRSQQRFAAVTHVAISLGDWKIIHSNGTAWGVSYNDMADENSSYSAWLRQHNLGIRRFL